MTDLVSGVLTRISELEQLARDAQVARGNGDWNVVAGPRQWGVLEVDTEVVSGGKMIARLSAEFGGYFHALHAVEHDPDAVLRLCRAHRQIVERHQRKSVWVDDEKDFPACSTCGTHYEYPVRWPCPTLRDLAVGLGVVEEDRK